MKYPIFIGLLFTSLLHGPLVYAQNIKTAASKITAAGENGLDQLETLTEQEPMKELIDGCKASLPPEEAEDRGQLLKCAWNNATAEDKKTVYAKLESAPGEDGTNKYSPGLSNFKVEKSSASQVLENYLMKRLEEALYGDTEDKKRLKVAGDHVDFYRIYRSQLGKSLITELSNFCIYSDEDGKISDSATSDELKKQKEENLKQLTQLNQAGTESMSYAGYSKCIGNIGDYCEKNLTVNVDGEDVISPCELNKLMTSVKLSLEKTEDLIETFEEAPEDKRMVLSGATINEKKVNINKITNIGSKELMKDSGYEEELNKIAQDLENNCKDVPNPGADPKCKDYLTKKSDNDKLLLEYELRNMALEEKVKDELNADSSEEKLKEILSEQGLSDEEYQSLKTKVQNEGCTNIEACIKDKIIARFKNERTQLVNSLAKKLEKTQYDEDPNSTSGQEAIASLTEKYKNSAQDIAQVYQYSNVVSSFIKISDGSKSNKANTAALAAELGSNYFDPNSNSRQTASQGGNDPAPAVDLSGLKGFASEGDDDDDPVNLESGQINEIQGWTSSEQEPQN